jgi:LysM domain
MKKMNLFVGKSVVLSTFVLSLGGVVPVVVQAQTAPSAAAESAAGGATAAATAAKAATKAPMRRVSAGAPTRRPLAIADNAPNTYTVVKGDTLWDISGKFLKEPWRWPEIWNMNRAQISNPHWIYPGDVVALTYDANGNPSLSLASGATGGTVKLSPGIRKEALAQAIPSIPARVIGPFLSLPLVVDEDALNPAPRIVATEDERVIVGAGNRAYAAGIKESQGVKWQIYRPGKKLSDPITGEVLGYEALYLGDARVSRFGESSTIEIVKSTQEIARGDRLTPTAEAVVPSFMPRSPDKPLKGAIVSLAGNVAESAQYSIVVINLGKRDGIEVGHVLASLRTGATVTTGDYDSSTSRSPIASFIQQNKDAWDEYLNKEKNEKAAYNVPAEVKLPDERNGLLFVFRTFDRVSYALVMSSTRQLRVGDLVQTPQQ